MSKSWVTPSPWARWRSWPAPMNMKSSPACAGCRKATRNNESLRQNRPRHHDGAGPYRPAGPVHGPGVGAHGLAAHLYPADFGPDGAHRLFLLAGGGIDRLLHRRRTGAADLSGRQPFRRRGHCAPGGGAGRYPRTGPRDRRPDDRGPGGRGHRRGNRHHESDRTDRRLDHPCHQSDEVSGCAAHCGGGDLHAHPDRYRRLHRRDGRLCRGGLYPGFQRHQLSEKYGGFRPSGRHHLGSDQGGGVRLHRGFDGLLQRLQFQGRGARRGQCHHQCGGGVVDSHSCRRLCSDRFAVPQMTAKIELIGVKKRFGPKVVLDGVDLTIEKQSSLVIIGGSGTGKSVTIKSILGIIRPDEGTILVDGEDVTHINGAARDRVMKKFGMLFQGGALFDSLPVWENVAFGLIQGRGMGRLKARDIAIQKLAKVGLSEDVAFLSPAELSGGMQKRVGLARAIAADPEIIFFDEPTTGLDPIMADIIHDLIISTVKDVGATALSITHDMTSARKISDKIAMLYGGKIIWQGPTGQIDHSGNPYVEQFIHGRAEGPIKMAVRG